MPPRRADPYIIEAAAKALDVLELFRGGRGSLTVTEVSHRLGLVKSTAFRLLYTLEKKGYLDRGEDASYRKRRRYRIGVATIDSVTDFVVEVNRGIEAEAQRQGVDLVWTENQRDAKRTLANVDSLVLAGVDLIIVYSPLEELSHLIADRCAQAGIPVVSITFPIPGARLVGINNYRAGFVGGEAVGRQVERVWQGKLESVLLFDIPGNSPAQQARITGMLEGLRTVVPISDELVAHVHSDRTGSPPEAVVTALLARQPRLRRLVVLSYNDRNALGAARALEQANRSDHGLVLAQGADPAVRKELRRLRSPMWGAVAHFPENFGRKLMPLAIRVVDGEPAPAGVIMEHALLTRSTIGQYYSNA